MSAFPLPVGVSDPLEVAYRALGRPFQHVDFVDGSCARCRREGSVLPIDTVVSRNFTAWEGLDAGAKGFCEPCAWAYSEPALRTKPVIVSEGTAVFATRADLRTLLSHPLSPSAAVCLPVSGKKHLLPDAAWGCLVSDDGSLMWADEAAEVMRLVLTLRAMGTNEAELSLAAPPTHLLLMATRAQSAFLFDSWLTLKPWQTSPYWAVLLRASRPTLASEEEE